jgi:1-acyl-sn-glycerol-3-phosphate acyltransferase
MGAAKATLKILFFVLGCILIMPLQGLVLLFTKGRGACVIPLIWHRAMCWNFQIRCKVVGTPNAAHQTLYMSNHISYLDISALSTVIPYSFVAKSEVQGWPLFGALAKLQRTAFIVRKRSQIVQETNAIAKRLEDGDSLIIFPEGTSSTGFDVLPFKSSLFTLALDGSAENLYVQPVTIRVLEVDGRKPSCTNIYGVLPKQMGLFWN